MSAEASKSRDAFSPYLQGTGIDIGCGPDPITQDCFRWDLPQGDAQLMQGLRPESFDWVFSAHCLEHLNNPAAALARWWALVRPGGHLLLAIPEVDSYEQQIWPSAWNPDHRYAFAASCDSSWCPATLNLAELVRPLPYHKLLRLEVVATAPPSDVPRDSTLEGHKAQVELVLQKLIPASAPYSNLAQVFACPCCRRQVKALGATKLGDLAMRCEACGATGEFQLDRQA